MSQIPIAWLMKKEGFEGLPLEQQVCVMIDDDRWYTKPGPLFLPKGHYWGNMV